MGKNVAFYHYIKCTTCRQARKFLLENGARLKERDFFDLRFSEDELRRLLKGHAVSEAFSRKSPQVKALGLKDKPLTDDEMIAWMAKEQRFIKRPIIVMGRAVHFGFQREEIKKRL